MSFGVYHNGSFIFKGNKCKMSAETWNNQYLLHHESVHIGWVGGHQPIILILEAKCVGASIELGIIK